MLFIFSLFLAVGVSTWLFSRLQRTSGNNTQRSLKAVVFTGLVVFIFAYLALKMLL